VTAFVLDVSVTMSDVLTLHDTGLASCDAMYLFLEIRHDLQLAAMHRAFRTVARKS